MENIQEYVLEQLRGYAEMLQILQAALVDPPEDLQQVKTARKWIKTVDRALEVLEPPQRAVIEHLYIYPKRGNVGRLAAVLHVESRQIYRIRDAALKKLAVALYVSAGN